MSLPLKAIDRLFDRLTATYGRDFTARWEGLDQNVVKSSWAHELSGFENCLHMIAWALENLPERAPNVIEFRSICRKAPALDLPALPEPKADPERVKAELAKLAPLRQAAAHARADRGDWARRILQRHADGAKISPTVLSMARDGMTNFGLSFAN